jgi:hypothetical protein
MPTARESVDIFPAPLLRQQGWAGRGVLAKNESDLQDENGDLSRRLRE